MLNTMTAYMRQHAMTQPGDTILAAVSGGADSTALLVLLTEAAGPLGLTIFAAHLDHGIRPESGDDAAFVAALCEELHVPCVVGRADVPALARERGLSLEVAAREERWRFLRHEAARAGARAIATAHHRGDQAETLLLRLVRGSGAEGLGAMRPCQGGVIRPLFWAEHKALVDYLRSRGRTWREDATNADPGIARNRIRHIVMPALAPLNPRVSKAIARSAALLRRDDDCLQALAREAWRHVSESDDGLLLEREAAALHPAVLSRLIRHMAARLGAVRDLTAAHVDAAIALITGSRTGASISWPGGLTARREAAGLALYPHADAAQPIGPVPLHVPGVTCVPGLGRFVCELLGKPPRDPAAFPGNVQHFDAERFPRPAFVRTRREGDRVRRLGAPGSRKLSDDMIDWKISRWHRDRVPLVAGQDEIVWVVGWAVAERTRITERTGATLRITYTPEWEEPPHE
ncbi:MAG: tRNA lysidine(34) synthetase TilS [Christensenellales bacterium]